ncbi:unnamed protein product [Somion occarium]|uniref:Uncharacterized protein n=1 Tax=Somion occarium TaxID=3059160 RepID=A0ABP1CT93_9APHY
MVVGTFKAPSGTRHGNKKALCIGIDYSLLIQPECPQLVGPHNDARDFGVFLEQSRGYQHVVVMVDDPDIPEHLHPTRDNIVREMGSLVHDAGPNDSLVFVYAGHIDQVKAKVDKNEADGMDEAIVPMDHTHDQSRLLLDDDVRRLIVNPLLDKGARLTAIIDSCHSGTLLDLDHDKCNNMAIAQAYKARARWIRAARMLHYVTVFFRGRFIQGEQIEGRTVMAREIAIYVGPSEPGSSSTVTLKSKVPAFPSAHFQPITPLPDKSLPQTTMTLYRPQVISAVLPPFQPLYLSNPSQPGTCSGHCVGCSMTEPNVVSISACHDGEIIFEDAKGRSLCQALLKILHETPELSYYELIASLRYRVRRTVSKLHEFHHANGTCAEILSRRSSGKENESREEVFTPSRCRASTMEACFWDPQICSQTPVDVKATFRL